MLFLNKKHFRKRREKIPETELKPTVTLGEHLLSSYDVSLINIFTSNETFVKNNSTVLYDSGTIQQSNSDKESSFLNNERKALINKTKAFEGHKQQGKSTLRTTKENC